MTPEEIEKIGKTVHIFGQTEGDGQTYIGASLKIDGEQTLVYPDALTLPELFRMLADELENPSD